MTVFSANRIEFRQIKSWELRCIGDPIHWHMCVIKPGVGCVGCRNALLFVPRTLGGREREPNGLQRLQCLSNRVVANLFGLQMMHDRVSLLNNPSNTVLINTRPREMQPEFLGTQKMHNFVSITDVSLAARDSLASQQTSSDENSFTDSDCGGTSLPGIIKLNTLLPYQ